jgi:probable phosphoglycerate mutase
VTGRRLVLLRHGRTSWNATGRAQGHADLGLDDVGHAQAEAAAAVLATMHPAALWTSDLARARETCVYVERATGLASKADDRLREFDVGARQGMTTSQFAETFPAAYQSWSRGEDAPRVPGAETPAEVETRMVPTLRECLSSLAVGETGVVVTHGACLKIALLALLGWPAALASSLRGMENCGWAVVSEPEPGGGLRLVAYNRLAGVAGGGVTDL